MNNETKKLLDDIDTALATLNIGRDHGITPQAAGALRDVWQRTREALKYEPVGNIQYAFLMQ